MSFVSSTPFPNESKCVSTDRYESTRDVIEVSNDETQSITHNSSATANPATPATIWFLVQFEMNVPMARIARLTSSDWAEASASRRPSPQTRIGIRGPGSG